MSDYEQARITAKRERKGMNPAPHFNEFDHAFHEGWQAALQSQLERMPCGHRRCEMFYRPEVLVDRTMAIDLGNPDMEGQTLASVSFCLSCRAVQEAVDKALLECLNIKADNAQFGLPKWVKDEINKLRRKP